MVWIFILASIRGALGYSSSIRGALGCSSSILEVLGCSSSILEVVIVVLKSPGLATALGHLSSSRTGDLGVTESLHSSRSLVCLIMGRRPRSDDLVSASLLHLGVDNHMDGGAGLSEGLLLGMRPVLVEPSLGLWSHVCDYLDMICDGDPIRLGFLDRNLVSSPTWILHLGSWRNLHLLLCFFFLEWEEQLQLLGPPLGQEHLSWLDPSGSCQWISCPKTSGEHNSSREDEIFGSSLGAGGTTSGSSGGATSVSFFLCWRNNFWILSLAKNILGNILLGPKFKCPGMTRAGTSRKTTNNSKFIIV